MPILAAARRLSSLWHLDPTAAAREVSDALTRGGNLRAAARLLGVGTMTLQRWVRVRPELAGFRKGAA